MIISHWPPFLLKRQFKNPQKIQGFCRWFREKRKATARVQNFFCPAAYFCGKSTEGHLTQRKRRRGKIASLLLLRRLRPFAAFRCLYTKPFLRCTNDGVSPGPRPYVIHLIFLNSKTILNLSMFVRRLGKMYDLDPARLPDSSSGQTFSPSCLPPHFLFRVGGGGGDGASKSRLWISLPPPSCFFEGRSVACILGAGAKEGGGEKK